MRPEVSPNEDTKKSLKCKVITKDQSVKDAIPFSLHWQTNKKIVVRTKNGITHLELIGFPVPVLVRLPANRPIFSSAQRGSTSIYQAHFRRQDIFLIESVVHQRLPPLWPLIQAYRQGHLRLTGFVLNKISMLLIIFHCAKH